MSILRAGLIGAHISRTRLPAALQIMCDMHGVTLEFELIDTAGQADFDFVATVEACRAKGWRGVTVTHPYKTRAAQFAGDGMLVELRGLGASNTLVFADPTAGHNTDFTGFIEAWRSQMTHSPGSVAMAGAGGVARALGPALAQLGAERIWIWDTDPGLADALAARIGAVAKSIPIEESGAAIAGADGLVNATPLGMREYPGSAFDVSFIGGQAWAFDAVYTPSDTEFLIAGRNAGLKTLSGFSLFQHMAMGSFEAYTGITPDADKVLILLDALKPD